MATMPSKQKDLPRPSLPDSIKVTMDEDLNHALRDAAYALRVPVTHLIREGLGRHVLYLQGEHNKGKAFPWRAGPS